MESISLETEFCSKVVSICQSHDHVRDGWSVKDELPLESCGEKGSKGIGARG